MSSTYHISYDLHKPQQAYDALIAEIKRSPGYYHIMQSTWLISTSESAYDLAERLRRKLDNDDSLLVTEISNSNYAGWLKQDIWNWLRAAPGVHA